MLTREVIALTGLTDERRSRTLEHLVDTGLVAADSPPPGAGYWREWSAADVADLLVCLAVRDIVGESAGRGGSWHAVARPLVDHWRVIGRPRRGWLVWDGEDALYVKGAGMLAGWIELGIPVVAVNVARAVEVLDDHRLQEETT